MQLLKKWQEEIQKDKYYLIKYYRNYLIIIESKNILIIDVIYLYIWFFRSLKTIKCAVEAFHAALETVAESDDPESLQYKVEGGASSYLNI